MINKCVRQRRSTFPLPPTDGQTMGWTDGRIDGQKEGRTIFSQLMLRLKNFSAQQFSRSISYQGKERCVDAVAQILFLKSFQKICLLSKFFEMLFCGGSARAKPPSGNNRRHPFLAPEGGRGGWSPPQESPLPCLAPSAEKNSGQQIFRPT